MQVLEVDALMFKKLVCMMLVLSMVLLGFCKTSFIYAEDDDDVCNSDSESYDKNACKDLYKQTGAKIKEIASQIKDAEADQEKAAALAQEYAVKAEAMEVEISALREQIDQLQQRISELEQQIATNEEKVEALNARVLKRMENAQKTMHFNGYLDFILGSKSFSDLLSRIYGVEAVVSKDESDRKELLEILTQLKKDKEELDASKKLLDENYDELVSKQGELLVMQEFYEEEIRKIQEQIDELNMERDFYEETFNDLADSLKTAGIIPNDGFVPAVHNSWISATVWNYDNDFLSGAWHLGVDYAASRGTAIHAPAGGVVIRADAGCGDPGYLGNHCGEWLAGGGNQVYMMCEVEGSVYGFIFFHMHDVYVEYGDIVLADETIGTVGSSGSSTGPHCHVEMYYLGKGELFDYLTMGWNATFSCGRGEIGFSNRCEIGNSAPCILNPELYLG